MDQVESPEVGRYVQGETMVAHPPAHGDAERFNLIASEYKAAPEVTRKRLYIETMQKVLGEANKVIDFSGGKNVLYLPIEGNKPSPSQTVEAIAPVVGATPESGKGGR